MSTLKYHLKLGILILKKVTLSGVFEAMRLRFLSAEGFNKIPMNLINDHINNKMCLEIGGPSRVFMGDNILPIYKMAIMIDNVDYSQETIWIVSDERTKERIFSKTITNEASDLNKIDNDTYNIVISSNVIEHLSNPLLALLEMKRVIRENGLIIVIVPHKDITFDHKRKITKMVSLIQNFKVHTKEGDISHLNLERIFEEYDLDLDPPAGDLDSFKRRTFDNISHRALHQVVFNTQLLLEMFNWAGIKILYVRTSLSIGHILAIGEILHNSHFSIS